MAYIVKQVIVLASPVLKIEKHFPNSNVKICYIIKLFSQDVSIGRSHAELGHTSAELVVVDDDVLRVLARNVEPLTGVAQVLVLHGQVLHQDGSLRQTVRVRTKQPVFLVLELNRHL